MNRRTQNAVEGAVRAADWQWVRMDVGGGDVVVEFPSGARSRIGLAPIVDAALAAQTPFELRRRLAAEATPPQECRR